MAAQILAGHKSLHRLAQMGDALVVNGVNLRQRSGGVGESGGCDERRMAGHAPIVPPYFCAAKTRGMG
jgi:hypothetical protein